ncbi:alpha/beta-hydrolase [Sparassis crispa]|uniref:Alpha/beta-hydrolase n=1 Tax=Sparassis crispa TaxID=139825 RepID=A0A401GRV6_9APHY|nr:alpha/beta-hydrolase [Sparassis crispa]GBE84981.1 alpha/beta-hydrolase [Sparassis crispa]
MSSSSPQSFTFVYKHVQGIDLSMDFYLPPVSAFNASSAEDIHIPALVYFHGGALTVGNRQSWFPAWLQRRITAAACAFVTVDYRLMPPATGHDILADVQDVFRFLSVDINPQLRLRYNEHPFILVDSASIAVAGSSSGGLCAYLAAMHASPKPNAVLSMYGMGGNFLTSQYFTPKSEVFFRGRELLDPSQFSEYLYPSSERLSPTADSPLAYHPQTYTIPGYPANSRMLLGRLYLQLGVYLDYYAGIHQPSLSAVLRETVADTPHDARELRRMQFDDVCGVLSPRERVLLPQFGVMRGWPPCFLVHGEADSAVLVHESEHMHALLQEAGVDVIMKVIAGEEHSLDYQKDADDKYGGPGGLFDEIADFLVRQLKGNMQ